MSRLDLQRLAAARLPGLPDGFVVEARPGVNLVLGANESGKSSFVRAVQRLLWPDRPGASPFEVTATFADDAGPLQAVRRDDGPVGWSRDGAPVPAPAVPEGHLAHCYRLGLLDLNRPDGDDADRELARQVRRQMSGGYDLAAVRELFPDRERAVGMRRRRWQETRRAADDEANAQRRLAREVRSLPAREAELEAARAAARRRDRCAAALAWREVRDRLADLTARLAALPEGTGRVRPDDGEALAALDARIRDKSAVAARLRSDALRREAQLAALAVGDGGAAARRRIEAATAAASAARETAREEARTAAVLAAARGELPPELAAADIPPAAAEAFDRLLGLHRDLLDLEARRDHLAALGRELGADAGADESPVPPVADERDLIAADLVALGAAPSPLLIVAGIAALAAAVAVGTATSATIGVLAAAVMTTTALVCGFVAWRGRRRVRSARRRLEAGAAAAARPLPANWRAADVLTAYGERAAATAARNLRAQLAADLAALAGEVADGLAAARARRAELLATWGGRIDPERPDLLHDLDRVARARTAAAVHAGAAAAHAHGMRVQDESVAAAREALAAVGEEAGSETADLQAALDRIAARQAEHRALAETQQNAREALAAAESDRDAAVADRSALLARIDLPALAATAAGAADGDPAVRVRAEIERRVAARPAWDELRSARDAATRELARLEALLDDPDASPGDLPTARLQAMTAAELRGERDAAAVLAERAEALRDEITATRTRADDARRGQTWAAARARADDAAAELADAVAAQREGALGRLLLDDIERQHETVTRPPLLRAADAHLSRFTGGRYRLRLGGTGPDAGFVALDNADRPRALGELSDGTRAQVLLAARLAFLDESEDGAAAPLFLDEALTASDPVRFAAIASALAELAADTGRQIFYLTSAPTDVAAFAAALAASGPATPHVIDLDARRRAAAAAGPAELRAPVAPPPPSPTGLDAATYAERLGVTPVRPWRSVADLDVFHLWRDDLAVVDALARGGVRTVGQWQRNGAALERAGVVDAATRRGTEARIAVWRSFRDGWRIGRGRPLEAGDLAGFGILSDLMLDAATALVAEVAGDADAFLARLQAGDVKRLRQDKKDALQEALERAGHVDDRPRRDEADLLAGCLAAVAPALAAGDLTTDAAAALVRRLKAAARA